MSRGGDARTSGTVSSAKIDAAEEPDVHSSDVFVSWAHSDEDWDSTHAETWARYAAEFTTALRGFGIPADIDLYHLHEPVIDWTRFGQARVKSARFVVVLMSRAWAERWAGTNTPTVGAGAASEADTLKGLYQSNQEQFQRKVLLVLLPGVDQAIIPPDLARLNRSYVDPNDADSFDNLLRLLTNQPLYVKPAVGTLRTLPPATISSLATSDSVAPQTALEEYRTLRSAVEAGDKAKAANADVPNERLKQALLRGMLDVLQDLN